MNDLVLSAPRTFPQQWQITEGKPPEQVNRITDHSARPRLGLRGPGVAGWCAGQGLILPSRINRCAEMAWYRVARLGREEVLLLPEAGAPPLPQPEFVAGVYELYREETWGWFRIEGPDIDSALVQLASADLRPGRVGSGDVVQARLAGLDAPHCLGFGRGAGIRPLR